MNRYLSQLQVTREVTQGGSPEDRLQAMQAAQELVEDYMRFTSRLREGQMHRAPSTLTCLIEALLKPKAADGRFASRLREGSHRGRGTMRPPRGQCFAK